MKIEARVPERALTPQTMSREFKRYPSETKISDQQDLKYHFLVETPKSVMMILDPQGKGECFAPYQMMNHFFKMNF